MNNPMQLSTLMVVHVPKAAGSTLRWIMDRQYPAPLVFKIGDAIPQERERLRDMPRDKKVALRAVFGHMCWGWHDALEWGQAFQYLTMLRKPTERVLSLYAYSQLPDHYMENAMRDLSVYDYVSSGVTRTVDNGMVRQLCGSDAFLREPYNDMVIPWGGVTTEHLAAAKANLEKCVVVGLAEEFDGTLDLCRRRLGWRIPPYRNQNVTRWPRPKWADLDQRTQDAVRACNELDEQLYEYARALHAKQRGAHG